MKTIKEIMSKAYESGIKLERKRVLELIDNRIDHHEPYRPITDSDEMKAVREELIELNLKINGKSE